jgi:membrane protein DedA with SNARE-associated domain
MLPKFKIGIGRSRAGGVRLEGLVEGVGLTEELVGKLGYLGIALLLVLGGLGLPVPEEAPIILAAVFSKSGRLWWPMALASCLAGVLLGDFVVYYLGYVYGEKVLSLRLTRKFLTKARETQIQGYFHRHGFKILILGRFAVGFRTAAYLTAGILKLPVLKLFLTDLFAASLSTVLMFGLGYVFAHQIQEGLDQAKYWLTAAAVIAGIWLLHRYYKARQRAGLPVGPRVLESVDVPLPPDDLHTRSGEHRSSSRVEPVATPVPLSVAPPPTSEPLPAPPSPPPAILLVGQVDASGPPPLGPAAPVSSEQRS